MGYDDDQEEGSSDSGASDKEGKLGSLLSFMNSFLRPCPHMDVVIKSCSCISSWPVVLSLEHSETNNTQVFFCSAIVVLC